MMSLCKTTLFNFSAEVNGHHHSSFDFDPRNPMASLENNPNVPKNCTITRPPPITRPGG